MSPSLRRLAGLAVLAPALAGCRSPSAGVGESRVARGHDQPIRRVLLVGTVRDREGRPGFRQAVEESFRAAAARCGVELSTPDKPNPGRPDARLEIRDAGGYVYNNVEMSAAYVAALTDLRLGQEVWKAWLNADHGSRYRIRGTDTETLASLAPDALFARMARDGVLRGCRAPEGTPAR